jgi:hypothetical protein
MIRKKLEGAVKRAFSASSIKRKHPKIEEWSILSMRPEMQAALDQRTWEALALARGRRDIEVDESMQRFLGFVSSVPSAGMEEVKKLRMEAERIAGPVAKPWSAKHIAVDQTNKLIGNLNHTIATGSAAIGGFWDALKGEIPRDNRENHLGWGKDELFFSIRGNWAEEKGWVNKPGEKGTTSPVAYFGDAYGEPTHPKANDNVVMPGMAINCFLPESVVQYANGVKVAYCRFFDGQVVEVVTATGKATRATPNHPILTPHGWVTIGALHEGDEVIELRGDSLDAVEVDHDQAQPSIAQIFAALRVERFLVARGEAENFHGDGVPDSDVEIVYAARPLSFGGKAVFGQRLEEEHLARADLACFGEGALDLGFNAIAGAPASGMGSGRQCGALFGRHAAPARDHAFAAVADGTPAFFQPADQCVAGDASLWSEGFDAFTGIVGAAKIVEVRRRRFAGHVYNLETEDGWYVCNGIVSKNCRCEAVYVYDLEDVPPEALTAEGRRELGLEEAA